MKISVICTVYEEVDTIEKLVNSITNQTEVPDEMIIVDGGSEDGTNQKLLNLQKKHEWLNWQVEEGVNISEGRNKAIKYAENEHILGIDGGCVAHEKWVEKMKEGFEEGHDALAGVFQYIGDTAFEKVQGEIRTHHYSPDNVSDDFNPSSRSVGFKKKVWRDAGKYPEHLFTGEDSRFNANLIQAGYDFHVVPDAVVYWRMRSTPQEYFKQFYLYGQGDARAGNMFDYVGKKFRLSKVFLMASATWMGIFGVLGSIVSPFTLSLTVLGWGMPYGYYLPHLKSAVNEVGLKALPLWTFLIGLQVWGHFLGYHLEKIRKLRLGELLKERDRLLGE